VWKGAKFIDKDDCKIIAAFSKKGRRTASGCLIVESDLGPHRAAILRDAWPLAPYGQSAFHGSGVVTNVIYARSVIASEAKQSREKPGGRNQS
jgi:hypothetical protein